MDFTFQMTSIFILAMLFLSSGCTSSEPTGDPHLIPDEFINLINPLAISKNSVEKGETLYKGNCEQCHGPEGLGDGPQAMMFEPRPSNLHGPRVIENPDGALYYYLTHGVRGTAMPSFRGLSEEDRWHLVNYLRIMEPRTDE